MSLVTLPYSVLLLLVEFCIGGQIVLYAVDLRGLVTRSYVKMSAAMVSAGAALALWLALAISPSSSIDGYILAKRFFAPSRVMLAVFLILALGYTWYVSREERRESIAAGGLASVAAVLALGLISAIVQQPTWSYAGTLLSLLAGGLALGGVTLAMTLGHWYLVTPRLPEQPLNEMTLGLLGILGIQVILLLVNLLLPVRHPPPSVGVGILQNPAFWLRVAVGILFPIGLSFMAWQSSRERGMMSATGLLYLATGAVMAGEALACALLFSTAIPG
ncbi:MAG: hypothetical protein ACR2PL_01835 [Dehalococcoidia bacterium]